jgi:hypothetical protein
MSEITQAPELMGRPAPGSRGYDAWMARTEPLRSELAELQKRQREAENIFLYGRNRQSQGGAEGAASVFNYDPATRSLR